MLIAYRIALAVMGLSALYAGGLNTLVASGILERFYDVQLSSPEAATAIDMQTRILAGMWTAMGLYMLYTIPNFGKHIVPLQFVFLGFALSALGEFGTMALQGNAAAALPKMLAQVGTPVGLAVWGHFAARKQVALALLTQASPDEEDG